MRRIARSLLMGLLIVQGTGFAAVEPPVSVAPAAASPLELEVATLNRSIQELVRLLREVLGRQHTDLLFKRIELGLQKMGPLENERRELLARRNADEEEFKRLQIALAARQAVEPQDPNQPENQDETAQRLMFEANVRRLKGRVAEADQRIAELDSELLRERRIIEQWEAVIDQRLGQR